jgi:hypothetical protein
MKKSGQTSNNPRISQFHNKIKHLNRFKVDNEHVIFESESEGTKGMLERRAWSADGRQNASILELVDVPQDRGTSSLPSSRALCVSILCIGTVRCRE